MRFGWKQKWNCKKMLRRQKMTNRSIFYSDEENARTCAGALEKFDAVFCGSLDVLLGPERSLYLADVGFSQVEHTDTGLADSAADRVWKLFIQDGFLEGKLRPLRAAGPLQLFFQGILIHADTHGRELQSDVEHRIVDDDIAV